jgi:hypothetical protein
MALSAGGTARDADTFGLSAALNVTSRTLPDEAELWRTTPGYRTGSRAGGSILPERSGQAADVGCAQGWAEWAAVFEFLSTQNDAAEIIDCAPAVKQSAIVSACA